MRSTGALLGSLALVGALAGSSSGAATPLDSSDRERQSAMFKRVFSYDRDLRSSEKIVVLIVAPSKGDSDVALTAEVFREQGLYPAIFTTKDLTDDLTATLSPHSTVVYVAQGVDYDIVVEFTARKGFLSISEAPEIVELGYASVGIDVDVATDRPEIVVNLERLGNENHELSSELLSLARVIR